MTPDPSIIKLQSGISLMELLVSLVIGLFTMTALIQSYVNAKHHQAITLHAHHQEQDANYALQLIAKDIRRAGYLGELLSDTAISGSLPPSSPNKVCKKDMDWGRMLQQPILGFNDTLKHNIQYDYSACISPQHYLRGDVITLRYLSPNTISNTELKNKSSKRKVYMRTSSTEGLLFQAKDYKTNMLPIIAHSQVRRVLSHTYFIGPSNTPSDTTCNNTNTNTTPALFRLRLNNKGLPQREELLQGIENIQFSYAMDINQDGIIDKTQQAHQVLNWQDVVLVQISITMYQPCIINKNNHYSTQATLKNRRL